MVDGSDNSELLMEQSISRRQFLQLGSLLPLSFISGAGGLAASLIFSSDEAQARTKKHSPIIKARSIRNERRASNNRQGRDDSSRRKARLSRSSPRKRTSSVKARSSKRNAPRLQQVKTNSPQKSRPEYHPVSYDNERALHLYNIHTDEIVNTIYWADGFYLPDGIKELNRLMRDHYTGEIVEIDPKLFDLLYTLCGQTEYGKPLHILSGYRCPATNNMLRELGGTVASHSLHMDGMAVDIRAPGLHTSYLRKAAVNLQCGGVGYYPYSDFVHVDTGPVRYW